MKKKFNEPDPAEVLFQRTADAFMEYYASTSEAPRKLVTATGERAAVYAYLYKLGLRRVAENIRLGMHLDSK